MSWLGQKGLLPYRP